MIRVLVVDDHPTMRHGIAEVLAGADDIEVAATAESGEYAVTVADQLHPDVVLMDISLPGISGVEATRRLLIESPAACVVMLTTFSQQEYVVAAIEAGAIGYLLKDSLPAEILRAVRAAARGESPLSPKAASAVLRARVQRRPADDLTPRERDVIGHLVRGLSNKQIALNMGISDKTVKTHLGNIFQRIGVEDRTQLALWARHHGIA